MVVSLAKPKGLQPPYRSVLGAHMDRCTMKQEAAVYSPKTRGSFKSSHGRFSFQYPSSPPCGIHLGLKLPHLHSNTQAEGVSVCLCVWEKGTFCQWERLRVEFVCRCLCVEGFTGTEQSPPPDTGPLCTSSRKAVMKKAKEMSRRGKKRGENN